MGKASRKLAKKQSRKIERVEDRAIQDKETLCREHIEHENYEEALGLLAEIAQTGRKDAEMMYLAAVCYFMTGDYERTATWINNTLTYEPGHIRVRVLLARLCLLQDREEEALAIFDFVLEHGLSELKSNEKDEIEETLEYYAHNEAEKLREHYPHVASFMKLNAAFVEETEKTPAIEIRPLQSVQDRTIEFEKKSFMKENGSELSEWEVKKQSILKKEISIVEKIKLLNAFAGAYYFSDDRMAAQRLLETALSLDAFDETSLRNLVVLLTENGEKEMAVEYAAKLQKTDFQLLKMIRKS